uniref:Uncharacterized protein n=1 Tax=Scleropages formosus TaxID=113540 RepID=A0A8C9U146_SCLFO
MSQDNPLRKFMDPFSCPSVYLTGKDLMEGVECAVGNVYLAGGGSSLDTVQRCVTALEDCFLFNAGKGSVFNREGKLEMEATIVDGSGMNSGSVACVQTVKNPIKAARQVMKNSRHALLVGDGAEQFLDSLEEKEKPVDLEYFHTDLRYKELEMKRKACR